MLQVFRCEKSHILSWIGSSRFIYLHNSRNLETLLAAFARLFLYNADIRIYLACLFVCLMFDHFSPAIIDERKLYSQYMQSLEARVMNTVSDWRCDIISSLSYT